MAEKKSVPVWDLPVRLFHWGLAAAVLTAIVAVQAGEMDLHERAGFVALTLVVFRVIWGLIGSETALFADFLRGPGTVRRYLKTGESPTLGHNPLGALSVVGLLALVAAQAGTGLFSNDDIFFDGPWAGWAGKELSDRITSFHYTIKNFLIGLVILHILAISFYAAKGENLLGAMISGRKRVEHDGPEPAMKSPGRALAALGIAVLVTGLAFRYW